ncbi:MAG: DNA polymerase III subunit alpha [Chloroflexi bacterium]|nr:DNA polymerase III subunit alpha [Chloroflexota bacterium]
MISTWPASASGLRHAMPYIELHAHSHYSFLDGASSPAELAARAAELGMPALALTDHQGLYGAIQHREACRAAGIQPIYGAEITLAPERRAGRALFGRAAATAGASDLRDASGAPTAKPPTIFDPGAGGDDDAPPLPGGHLTLLVGSATGWANLCRMLSAAGLAGAKHHRPVSWALLARHAEGLICLSGCREGVLAAPARRGDRAATLAGARALREIFGPDRLYVELQRHREAGDRRLSATLEGLARHLGLPLLASNNVHYARPEGFRLQHVLACIKGRCSLDEAGGRLYAAPHRYLKGTAEMAERFGDLPAALSRTLEVAERCRFELDLRHARLPDFPVAAGETLDGRLRALCERGLETRYGARPPAAPRAQLEKELAVIASRGLAGYFLVVHEIVDFARREGIACQGRGSAAGSLAAYCLGISPVDPIAQNLLFERFLSESSSATPDIDIDFAGDRREEVIQHVYQRYGAERAGMVANVVTFRARSAVADVAKALGFPAELREDLRAQLYRRDASGAADELEGLQRFAGRNGHLPWQLLLEMCRAIDGFPRHLSIHSGGMLITRSPLAELVPLEPASMPGRVVVQWDKDDVEDAGLIKIDLLSLRTLGMVSQCFTLIRARGGPELTIDTVPQGDPEVWAMLGAADSLGCFQVESRAQMSLLPRLRPSAMADLIVEVALIRPGPVAGGMARAYLERRDGAEPVGYWHPALEPVLAETLGVLVFQEQVLRVAMTLAGFSGGQADDLRRAMSRKRSLEAMERLRSDFVAGAEARGVETAAADQVFDRLTGFAGYGFCKSHAAAFARLAWVTAWLKCHHAPEFYCALLEQQPMGFYSVRVVVEDAKRHGIGIAPLHVNRSAARWRVESGRLRVPLARLKGLGEDLAERIAAEREARGPYASLWDFLRRVRPPRRIAERLVRAGALDGLDLGGGGDTIREPGATYPAAAGAGAADTPGASASGTASPERRQLLWALGEMQWPEGGLDLPPVVTEARLRPDGVGDRIEAEGHLLGLAQGEHPMARLRPRLAAQGLVSSAELEASPEGARRRVAGRVEIVQRPGTAKGICFVSLEDEFGLVNLVLFPKVYEQHRRLLREAPVLLAEGRVQHEHGSLHLIVQRVLALEPEALG